MSTFVSLFPFLVFQFYSNNTYDRPRLSFYSSSKSVFGGDIDLK